MRYDARYDIPKNSPGYISKWLWDTIASEDVATYHQVIPRLHDRKFVGTPYEGQVWGRKILPWASLAERMKDPLFNLREYIARVSNLLFDRSKKRT